MIQEILEERGNRYGEFSEHARITQEIKETLTSGDSWELCTDSQREALEMIAHKLGRIVNGDPTYDDSWVDIIGYSQLVLDEISDEPEIDETEDEIENIEDINDLSNLLSNIMEDIFSESMKSLDTEKELEDKTETDISEIEINGIKVLISDSEFKKLKALEESELYEATNEDHNDQTYIKFDDGTEITYSDYEEARLRLQEQGVL